MHYRELSTDELIAFFDKEKTEYSDLTDNELDHLKVPHVRFQEMAYVHTTIIGIFNKQEVLIGFCLLPTYSKNIAKDLYIGRAYRNQGFGSGILNALKIESLNCLIDNSNAIRLYEGLGFQRKSITSYSIRFERKLT